MKGISLALYTIVTTLESSHMWAQNCLPVAHIEQLHDYFPMPQAWTTWTLDSLANARLSQDIPHLRAEWNTAQKECNEYMATKGHLQQKLADLEAMVN